MLKTIVPTLLSLHFSPTISKHLKEVFDQLRAKRVIDEAISLAVERDLRKLAGFVG
jgi:hypothetical protein